MAQVKELDRKMGLIGAAIAIVTMIAFCIYGAVYDYFDTGVVIFSILGAVCGALYAFFHENWSKMLNLLGILMDGIAMGVFFLNSYYVWADRLNNIEMYGSRGTLTPVVAILVLFILSIVSYIISCFTGKEKVSK